MTNHKNLIKRAKAALDWSDTDGLRLLAPDLARALIETTEQLEQGAELIAAFRKAMEDDQ